MGTCQRVELKSVKLGNIARQIVRLGKALDGVNYINAANDNPEWGNPRPDGMNDCVKALKAQMECHISDLQESLDTLKDTLESIKIN